MYYLWLVIGSGLLGFLGYRAGRVWLDAGQRGFEPARRLGWALFGAVASARYWWGARIEALSTQERDALLVCETKTLGLGRADSIRCPLCNAEVSRAWTLTSTGRPTVGPGPIECPACDFRLDACRHCTNFMAGTTRGPGASPWLAGDVTTGRCNRYKASQPVEQACAPDMAHRLRTRGYEQVRAPLPILDSYLPPDHCTAYAPDRSRLQASGIPWPDDRRTALLRLLAPPVVTTRPPAEGTPSGDERWLL
jgi:hypothetical protein